MGNVNLETIHRDIAGLKKEIHELRIILVQGPELREDIAGRVNEARQRIKTDFVAHEQMKREFMA